nr:hypothetical protein [Candidatus Sigynarchaeum springense]
MRGLPRFLELRPTSAHCHNPLATIAIIGFCTAGIVLGIMAIERVTGDLVPRRFGIFMLFISPLVTALFLVEIVPPSGNFYEWMVFFSIQARIVGIAARLFGAKG